METPAASVHVLPLAVLDSLGDGVTLANEHGRIIFSNQAAKRILGVGPTAGPPDEWTDYYGSFLPDGVTRFPADAYPLVRALRGEETNNVEILVRNGNVPDGVLISATGRPLRSPEGVITGAAVVFRDVTALRRAELDLMRANQALRDARRREAELSAFVVHDLKSPLTSVLLGVQALLDRDGLDRQLRSSLSDIRESARSTHRMVLDLLDVHLGEDGALIPEIASVDVPQLLNEVRCAMHPRLSDTRQELSVAADASGRRVRADRELLRRVLQNLIDNCVRYGPPGGTIYIDAHAWGEASMLLRVRDQGPGVPPKLRERIFEKYALIERDLASRHSDGRGLGLPFCKVAVAANGGRIWVEDNQPRGACFCVELPLAG